MGFLMLFKMLYELIFKVLSIITLLFILTIIVIPVLFIFLFLGPHYVELYFEKTCFIFEESIEFFDFLAEKGGIKL